MAQCREYLLLLFVTLGCQCLVSKGTPVSSPLSSEPPQGVGPSEIANLPLLVPDISKVDGKLLKEADADKFLALWSVYVSGKDVMVSDEPWTLFLPLNTGLPRDPSFLTDQEFTRDLLLNHVILGEVINIEAASLDPSPYYTLAHSEVIFTLQNGEFFMNNVRITGDILEFENGIIYLIEETLPLDQPEFLDLIPEYVEVDNPSSFNDHLLNLVEAGEPLSDAAIDFPVEEGQSTNTQPPLNEDSIPSLKEPKASAGDPVAATPRATRFDKFRNVASKKEDAGVPSTTTVKEPTTTEPSAKPDTAGNLFNNLFSLSEKEGKSINAQPPENEFSPASDSAIDETFLSSLKKDLEGENSAAHEFLNHFNNVHLERIFQDEKRYTALVPTEHAFYDYYPIDWGFNPFQVDNFTKDVLLNHILPGDIDIYNLDNETWIETLGGRKILVTKDAENRLSYLNGEPVSPESEVIFPKGRIYFLNKILFVDYDRVNALRDEYPFLETGPLLGYHWPTSPFLSHLFKRLKEGPTTQIFAQLLFNSNVAHLVPSIDQNMNRLSYSAFVPSDVVLQEIIPLNEIKLMDSETISEFLLSHLFHDYVMQEDLTEGRTLESLSGSLVPITVDHDEIWIGSAKITEPQQFLYNLGSIYMIDKSLHNSTVPSINLSLLEEMETEPTPAAKDEDLEGRLDSPLKKEGLAVPFPSGADIDAAFQDIFSQKDPDAVYETRTEVSFSKRINDGENIPVPKEIIQRAKDSH